MKTVILANFQQFVRSPWTLIQRSGMILYAAALLSMAAALIHLWVTPEHFGEWWGYGTFMLTAAICQGLFAVVVLRWPNKLILCAGIAGNLAIIGLYGITRFFEIPFGPHAGHIEEIGATDLLCTASEIGLVALLAVLLRGLRSADASVYSRPSARPLALGLFSFTLAYGGGLWLYLLHRAEGAVELNEPPFLVHWLRDSTLALPLVFLAVWMGIGLARRILDGRGELSPALSGAVTTATVAALASVFMASGSPVHEVLFHAHHGGHDLSVYLHVGRDTLLALAVNLPLAALVSLMLRGDPWSRPEASRRVRYVQFKGRFIAQGATAVLGLMLPAVILAWGTLGDAQTAAAANDPGSPCPVAAPVKTFDVTAIDVDITLNRFGDHDPDGKMYVLTAVDGVQTNGVQKVRQEETAPLPNRVSIGLGYDAIQPLVMRANQGDCVKIHFTNNATGGDYGIHIDGLAFEVGSSGDQIGANPSTAVPQGGSADYAYYIPNDDNLEGDHYIRPGPGNRFAVEHGLFGSLTVEPPGSRYLNIDTNAPLTSGWEASIVPGGATATTADDAPAFREYVQIYHEIGNEKYKIKNAQGGDLPTIDPHTDAYRPGSRAINYRSEPFENRLDKAPEQDSVSYSSYTFGDPAVPIQRSYLGDPTKMRITHGGGEMFHVFHMHGGGIRWRFNPVADTTYNYADTGLDKHPKTQDSPSTRLDSQAFGPGESYNLEIEGGAGGVQQGAGEFLFHCHIPAHYVSGMWGFWRVYNTAQPDLKPLPDRQAAPAAVDSAGLIGKTINGTTITKDNLDDWIRPQLPTQGVPKSDQDASVWNWAIDNSNPDQPVYLGEPEDKGPWPDLPNADPNHPGAFPGDQLVGPDDRRKIMFDPINGRPAFPLLRPQIGKRPPFSPNGHSGAPYLGETGDQPSTAPPGGASPWANRTDGICPSGAPVRKYNVVSIGLPIQVTKKKTDQNGKIFVLAQDKADILAGRKPAEPLAIRGNIGDCIAVTLTSEQEDANATSGFAKSNIHIHHVQFDTQASDGVITGLSFEQSVRPYTSKDPNKEATLDPTLTTAAGQGDTTLRLSNVAKFQNGVWIGVGLGTNEIEIHQIKSIDPAANTVTLTTPLKSDHAPGQTAGTEFVQYRWYPDVQLDNIFFHDHIDGIHDWGHGLVGQLIVEPKGSTYHDPKTGAETDGAGTITDIHTNDSLAPGVQGSFREMALWTIDGNPVTDATLNLRAEPFADRLANNGDPSLLFSSYTHGDPNTPLPKAYPGDPFVIRTINVSPGVDTLHVDGHRFRMENRYTDANGNPEAKPIDTIHYGVSERYTAILQGGAGGMDHKPGDYLYFNGIDRHFQQGAWGILRVLPGLSPDLKPLPGTSPPSGGALPSQTGGRPPATADPGNPCPAGAPQHDFNVSAATVPGAATGGQIVFVPTADAAAVKAGTRKPEPLVLHAAAGECVTVNFTNDSNNARASFHLDKLESTPASSGVNVGFNSEQTVAQGQSRTYRYYADTDKIGTAIISDFGGTPVVPDAVGAIPVNGSTGKDGLYGAMVIAPAGATFTDPVSGDSTDVGTQVDVHLPGAQPSGYRDFTLAFSDNDTLLGQNTMPYPIDAAGPSLVNYASAPLVSDTNAAFSGTPPTPLLRAYRGDPVQVHAIGAPGSEQMHVFSLGGQSWSIDPNIDNSNQVDSQALGPWETIDAEINGGAGGRSHATGDFYYGDLRRPFTQAGMWGLFRVSSDAGCAPGGTALKPLPGRDCTGAVDHDAPTLTTDPGAKVFNAPQQVKILSSEPAKIHFTTDGSKPTQRSPLYKTPLTVDKTQTVKAIAIDPAGNRSAVASWDFTIDTVAPTVSANPKPGTYDQAQQVKLQASESGSRIFYTTDGSTPTPQSTELQPGTAIPVGVSRSIKAIAVDPAGNASDPATFAYTIRQASKVMLNVATTPLKLGKVRTIAGVVSPSHAGSVRLTIKRNGKTVLAKSLPLKSSRFSMPYTPRAVGSYSVIVNFAGDADHKPSTANKSFNVVR